jgi:hypothetical protein
MYLFITASMYPPPHLPISPFPPLFQDPLFHYSTLPSFQFLIE